MGFLDYLEKGWDYLTDAGGDVVDWVLGTDEGNMLTYTSKQSGSGGFLDTLSDFGESAWGFITSDTGKNVAGFMMDTLYGPSGVPKAGVPKAQMIRAPRSTSGGGSYQASAADLGYTARVMNAAQVAARKQGQLSGSIPGTINMLRTREARGPLLRIESPSISVRQSTKA